jgi:hypothetical protein
MEIIEAIWERFPAEWRVWAIVGVAVLLGVEVLATGITMSGRAKRLTSIVAGPLAGVALYLAGQVDVPLHGEYAPSGCIGDETRHVLGAALFGFGGTLAAIGAHDLGGGELLKRLAARAVGRTSTPEITHP